MKCGQRLVTTFGLSVSKHVQRDSTPQEMQGAHPVDRLLHFAMTTVSPFHSIGGRRKEFLIQEGQRFLPTASNDGCPTPGLEGRTPRGPGSCLGQHTLAHGVQAHEMTICVGQRGADDLDRVAMG